MGWFEDAVSTAAVYNPTNAIGQALNFGSMASGNGIAGLGNPLHPTGGAGKDSGSGGLTGSNAAARNSDMEAGYKKGKEIFYDDPDMIDLRNRYQDLSSGYNGQELGAMREQARSETEGQRNKGVRQLGANLARAGVGGARGAAMQSSADQGYAKNRDELERKMTLDNANLVRSGTNDLKDYLMRQKYGVLGTGLGYAQLGTADRTAEAQTALANKEPKRGIVGQLWEDTVGSLF